MRKKIRQSEPLALADVKKQVKEMKNKLLEGEQKLGEQGEKKNAIKQECQDLEESKEKLTKDVEELEDKRDLAAEEVNELEFRKTELKTQVETAKSTIADVEKEKEKILEDARVEAKRIVEKANLKDAEARRLEDLAKANVTKLELQVNELLEKIRLHNEAIAGFEDEIKDKKKEKADVEDEINNFKALLAELKEDIETIKEIKKHTKEFTDKHDAEKEKLEKVQLAVSEAERELLSFQDKRKIEEQGLNNKIEANLVIEKRINHQVLKIKEMLGEEKFKEYIGKFLPNNN